MKDNLFCGNLLLINWNMFFDTIMQKGIVSKIILSGKKNSNIAKLHTNSLDFGKPYVLNSKRQNKLRC